MINAISLKCVRFYIVFGIVKVCDRQWFFCNFSTLKYLKMFCSYNAFIMPVSECIPDQTPKSLILFDINYHFQFNAFCVR